MQTLDQAIQARLDEKRRAREAAAQAKAEREAAIRRQEQLIAQDSRRILEAHYGFSLAGVEIVATWSHDDHYNVALNFGNNRAVTNSNIYLKDLYNLPLVKWEGLHTKDGYSYGRECFDDLLEAIIFAQSGKTEEEAEGDF